MKTYKEFREFMNARKYMVLDCALAEAAVAGFSRFQIWLYTQRMKWHYIGRPRFRVAVRRAGRAVWWCLVIVGAFFWFQRLNKLMDMTTYKNQTEIARNAIYVCHQMPETCQSAAKLVESAMK